MDNPFNAGGSNFQALYARLAQLDPERFGMGAAFASSPYEQAQMDIQRKRDAFQQTVQMKQLELQALSQQTEAQRQMVLDQRAMAQQEREFSQRDRQLNINEANVIADNTRQNVMAQSTLGLNAARMDTLNKKSNDVNIKMTTQEATKQREAVGKAEQTLGMLDRLSKYTARNKEYERVIQADPLVTAPNNSLADRMLTGIAELTGRAEKGDTLSNAAYYKNQNIQDIKALTGDGGLKDAYGGNPSNADLAVYQASFGAPLGTGTEAVDTSMDRLEITSKRRAIEGARQDFNNGRLPRDVWRKFEVMEQELNAREANKRR